MPSVSWLSSSRPSTVPLASPSASPMRRPAAEFCGLELAELSQRRRLAEIAGHELEEARDVVLIGDQRVAGQPPLALQPVAPRRAGAGEGRHSGRSSQARMVFSSTLARKN